MPGTLTFSSIEEKSFDDTLGTYGTAAQAGRDREIDPSKTAVSLNKATGPRKPGAPRAKDRMSPEKAE